MSVHCVAWVLHNAKDVSPPEKLLLLSLADEADSEGVNCWPGMRRLADHTNQSVSGVRDQLQRLESYGHLLIVRPERQGRGNFNRYGLVMGRDVAEVAGLMAAEKGCARTTLPDGADESGKGADEPPFDAELTREKGVERGEKGSPQVAHTQDPTPMTPTSVGVETFSGEKVSVASDARDLCEEFADFVQRTSTNGKRPTVSKAWLTEMDRMLRLDGRTADHVRACMRWLETDRGSFWLPNVRSVPTLRAKFEQMSLQAKNAKATVKRGVDKNAETIATARGVDIPK